MSRIWELVKTWIAAKTGLWRINAVVWNRQARRMDELAAEVSVAGLADSAELLSARARRLRTMAREAKP
jgi:hypothetical protein